LYILLLIKVIKEYPPVFNLLMSNELLMLHVIQNWKKI
jgi:hypothetical protein